MENSTREIEISKDKQAIVRTHSGKMIDVLNPDPALITIDDIAHALAHIPRFGGHLDKPYSVAQHCIAVCHHKSVPLKDKLGALMHDASEYLLLDMPAPIKKHLPDYKAMEAKLTEVIEKKYGFEMTVNIKGADMLVCEAEYQSMHDKEFETHILSAEEAKAMFLAEFYKLMNNTWTTK